MAVRVNPDVDARTHRHITTGVRGAKFGVPLEQTSYGRRAVRAEQAVYFTDTDYVGDARLTKYGVRFTSQVWPGDTLDSTATVKAITERGGAKYVELDVTTVNQAGTAVLSGYAEARLDP